MSEEGVVQVGFNQQQTGGFQLGDDMKYEEARLTTFRSWPANAKVEAWKMAKAGLLYTGQMEEVECFTCGCTISDWQYGDQVMSKHRQANPGCPFIQNQSNNVPLLPGGGNNNNHSLGSGAISRTHTDASRINTNTSGFDVVDGGGGGGQQQQHGVEEDTDDVSISRTLASMRSMSESDHVTSDMRGGEGSQNPQGNSSSGDDDSARLLNHMKHEFFRLASFTNWTKPFISPADLAKAGFFYLNRRDSCRCAFCANFVGDWEEGDVPMNEHRKLFPLCGFVQGRDVGNVEIGDEEVVVEGEEAGGQVAGAGHDEAGIREYQMRPHSGPENQPLPGDKSQEELGIISHHGPMHPSYATPDARIRSFKEWPPGLKVQPKELVDAGFYYIGLSDQVKCFYCDGGLRNWHSDDDPWVEHARWFNKCAFVRLQKGDEFIRKCIESKPPEEPHEIPAASGSGGSQAREVTEDEIRIAMSEAIVRQVLSMGIDPSRVKMAIKKQLESYGYGFNNPEHLINAAFTVQRQQERRVNHEHNNPSGAMLAGINSRNQQGSQQRRSFDEVTMRRWEEEMYMSTEDEDEPQEPPRPVAGQPSMSSFRSLPSGVKLAPQQSTAATATSASASTATSIAASTATSTAASSSSSSSGATTTSSIPSETAAVSSQEQPGQEQLSASSQEQQQSNEQQQPMATDVEEPEPSIINIAMFPKDASEQHATPGTAEESLELENARLKEQRTCKVCMDTEVGVVFLPCGHLICCVNCAPSLKDCAVCRTPIQGTVRTFMS